MSAGEIVLWQVAAQGYFINHLGRRCFSFGEAEEIARDLRARGYADAHAQRYDVERSMPAFALRPEVR